jgi:hypothetical protein
MLEAVRVGASPRKLWLFVCAALRRLDRFMAVAAKRAAVETTERFVDGQAPEADLLAAWSAAWGQPPMQTFQDLDVGPLASGTASAEWAMPKTEQAAQCHDLRCLFGDPFRPVALNRRWLTPVVSALAGAAYDERAYDRLPILADALEDAGCDNAGLLGHLRGPGPHVRGCWALDLLLGLS